MGKTSAAVKNRYNAKTYDRINLTVPKGYKERISAVAGKTGESVNGYIKRLIDEDFAKN
jgi:predicted HicB family RNase H-like nuclease